MDDDARLTGQVRELMADTFGIDEIELPDAPSQAAFARWTSLLHMVLVAALEDRFAVRFSMDEMMAMTSFDRIVALLREKSAAGTPA